MLKKKTKQQPSKSWKSNKEIKFHSHIHNKSYIMSQRKATEDIKIWGKKHLKSSLKEKRAQKNYPTTAYLYLSLNFHPSWILLNLFKQHDIFTINCNRLCSTEGGNSQQKAFQAFSFLKQAQRTIQNYCTILTGHGNKTFNSPQLSNNMFKTHASNEC